MDQDEAKPDLVAPTAAAQAPSVPEAPAVVSAPVEVSAAPADPLASTVQPTWMEQDPILRDLWGRNLPPVTIAEQLNRSVAAIMTRAARLGLPRRFAPGRKAGQRYASIAPTPTKKPRERTSRGESSVAYEASAQAADRICLMCLKKFPSEGRHNRICPSCKGSPEYVAGSRIPDISYGESA